MQQKLTKKEAKKAFYENGKIITNENLDGFVVLKNINKIYDNKVQAVYDFNLSIKPKEFIVLVGPSGCGKSTTLRMIAGLEEISSGYLYIDKVLANHLESKDRNIAMVFQSYALYPNMSVYDNIGFGLKIQGMSKDEIQKRVFNAAKILDLGPYLDRKPKELSGGQMQRVALGRAIVRDAKLFLMDEPLSNLDAKLRVQMRSEIVKIHNSVNATTVYVTHDQTEAMTMADRIVIMNKGFVQQISTPIDIYNNPKNIFVATFIGNPPMNVFEINVNENIASDGINSFVIPESYINKYDDFIKNKISYFNSLKKCVDVTIETKLISDIKQIIKNKAYDANNINGIISSLKDLANEKELLKLTFNNLIDLLNASSDNLDLLHDNLLETIQVLDETTNSVDSLLKKFESSSVFAKEKEEVKEQNTSKKKSLFKKKEKIDEVNLKEKQLGIIDNYINQYKVQLSKNRNILIGIRPEDIYLSDEYKGNPSTTLSSTISFSELMGSEYFIHTDFANKEIIIKLDTSRLLKINEKINFVINLDKIKLFDKISGENVLWQE